MRHDRAQAAPDQHLSYTTYAVGVFRLRQSAPLFLILFVFALCERKNEKNVIGKYWSHHRRL